MSTGQTPSRPQKYFAIVPAAGVGSRVGHATPKQYLALAGSSALEWSVRTLLSARWIDRVVVVVAERDLRAHAVLEVAMRGDPRLRVAAVGGATRRDTVLAALDCLDTASEDDFVLVHDAARPGLDRGSLERLRDELGAHPTGGLLALALDDTLKRASATGEVGATLPREGLWLAQTPQMFRYRLLRDALSRHPAVTDEAGAIEADGLELRVVRGERANFKITTAEDLAMMDVLLRVRAQR
ncbi:MAG: 2-C-methyl-D-erythritol 4-phosphate cytidylyltransferase [Burkholderiaceae bacterium]|nr:2-C-methyl-D-erythritol 4-phosphate cytidylyltransferase [Burkholderiaceae bacterium]